MAGRPAPDASAPAEDLHTQAGAPGLITSTREESLPQKIRGVSKRNNLWPRAEAEGPGMDQVRERNEGSIPPWHAVWRFRGVGSEAEGESVCLLLFMTRDCQKEERDEPTFIDEVVVDSGKALFA